MIARTIGIISLAVACHSNAQHHPDPAIQIALIPRYVDLQSVQDSAMIWVKARCCFYALEKQVLYFPSIRGAAFLDTSRWSFFGWQERLGVLEQFIGWDLEMMKVNGQGVFRDSSYRAIVRPRLSVDMDDASMLMSEDLKFVFPSASTGNFPCEYDDYFLLLAFRPEEFGMVRGDYLLRLRYHYRSEFLRVWKFHSFPDKNFSITSNSIMVRVK